MKSTAFWRRAAWAGALALLVCLSPVSADPTAGQTLELHPGWNAVFLEVQPAGNTPAEMFGTLPLSSVWAWSPKRGDAEFSRNVSETMYNDSRWLAYFPTNRVESMFNSLFRIYGNKAYLVKLASASNVTWSLTGVPAIPRYSWKANAFNLAGFPLNPEGTLPDLGAFFAPSSAFKGQAAYRLDGAGTWVAAPQTAAEVMRAGEALWVYAADTADYMGPVSVETADGSGLSFAGIALEKKLTIANLSAAAVSVQVRNLSGPGPVSYWRMAGTEAFWDPLPEPLVVPLAAGESVTLRISVRREAFAAEVYETVIEVTSDIGTRVRLPLTALKTTTL